MRLGNQMMMKRSFGARVGMPAAILAALILSVLDSEAQQFPPGTFSIDGIPIVCGTNTFIMNAALPDVGMNHGNGFISLNPMILAQLPTVLKLYWVGHECGHSFVGMNEVAADCWAVRTGKAQNWFPPAAFAGLMAMFQNNPGDMAHPAGPVRVQMMWQCYNSP
ncbi:hypothetical protein [Bradyrhizobium tunisiense]|uniref:hypothetical protein n=1 Tax=Bradyrhizobium tunisiense TaxID=3278709 RepID=UPI0035E2B08C